MKEQITDLVESIVDEKPVDTAQIFEEVMLEKLRQKVADHEPVVAASLFDEEDELEEVEEDELAEGGFLKALKQTFGKQDLGKDEEKRHLRMGVAQRNKAVGKGAPQGKTPDRDHAKAVAAQAADRGKPSTPGGKGKEDTRTQQSRSKVTGSKKWYDSRRGEVYKDGPTKYISKDGK